MNRYIILGTFFNMGGGQLYTRNKADYMKKNGWEVDVYTGRKGELLIPEMTEYQNNYFPELDILPFYSSETKRQEVIDTIAGLCITEQSGNPEEIIIESSKAAYAVWGEMIAERLKAKHVFFNLDEEFPEYSRWYYEFIAYKHKRRELCGISPISLQKMFKNFKTINSGENYSLKFICENQITNQNNAVMAGIEKADINFGAVTRLDKGYVLPMADTLAKLAQAHQEKSFSFVLVGGADDASILKNIELKLKRCKNLAFYPLGYLSPIPSALMDYVDFFIGTAGSASMTAAAGKVTVAVDTNSGAVIGVVGYDTQTRLYSDNGSKMSLYDYLEKLVFHMNRREIENIVKTNFKENMDYMLEFNNHMNFINSSEQQKQYFIFDNFSLSDKLKFWIVRIAGVGRSRAAYRKVKAILARKRRREK